MDKTSVPVAAPEVDVITERGFEDDEEGSNEDLDAVHLEPDPKINTMFPGTWGAPTLANLFALTLSPIYFTLQCAGCFTLKEKEQAAVLYFGKYTGTVSEPGVHFLNPFCMEMRTVSTAMRTMDMKNLKVVDSRGNPVIVSAVVTFEATSARKARIDVNNPWPGATWQPHVLAGTFLQLQAQAVLKQVTSKFPYEAPEGEPSLQTEGKHITELLVNKLQHRVDVAGAKILSFDLVDLSYAPEIAQSMLLRQQAAALVDARKLIVQAAVDMTHDAIETMHSQKGRSLSVETEDRIITNLMTVICSHEGVTPTVSMDDGYYKMSQAMDDVTKAKQAATTAMIQAQSV